MRRSGNQLDLTATDLSNFLGCRHRTALDMGVALSKRERPKEESDPLLELLWKRGLDHEAAYVHKLTDEGRKPVDLREFEKDRNVHVAKTADAIKAGVDVIVQGALRDGPWFGKPDVLRKLPASHGYEVIDTKLARETKAGTILQLGLYSEMLELVQGARPEYFHVVTPYGEHTYRLDDYAAYIRMVRRQLLATSELDPQQVAESNYPEPVTHCDTCQWSGQCAQKRRDDDHLSLIAGIPRMHRRELETYGIKTLTQFASVNGDMPEDFKPKRGQLETFLRFKEQAQLQQASRGKAVPLFKLRPIEKPKEGEEKQADEGLCRLPEPSPGDVFLDLEGDPFAGEFRPEGGGGREYLFGLVTVEKGKAVYQAFWGMTEREERESFEKVMDLIEDRRRTHPGMHVYHYAPYEPSAFKRLMGRYVTRGRELDLLLAGKVFVDLYGVIRQGVMVGTERYSIKNLEPLYDFKRTVRLLDADRCLRQVELGLEINAPETIPPAVMEAVRGYNEDDCVSTLRLRDWLEKVRAEHIAKGWEISRPNPPTEEVEKLTERDVLVRETRAKLLKGVSEKREDRDDEHNARWLLAYLLDYHRREDKAVWWEYFRLRDLTDEELLDEPQAIAQMKFVKRVGENKHPKTGKPTGKVTDRYGFPPQEMEVERGDLKLKDGGTFGTVVAVDRTSRTVDVLKQKQHAALHPTSVFAFTYIPPRAQEKSLDGIAARVLGTGGNVRPERIEGSTPPDLAARSLLLGLAPRLRSGAFNAPKDSEDIVAYLNRTVVALDHSVLSVQGPPGSGKTYCGAEMICELVKAGKKIGVTATSHKVIRNLLDEVVDAAKRRREKVAIAHRCDADDFDSSEHIACLDSNGAVATALSEKTAQVVGGTSWVWAHESLMDAVDVLFVDEAGQVALANVLAMSPAAESIVLLGDPQQLNQPTKAAHPDGVGASALSHMLRGERTIPSDRGVFLPLTWRLAPRITSFTSELFYENRLQSKPGLEVQRLDGVGDMDGAGLWVVNVEHDGNRTSSIEEIEAVAGIVERLTRKGVRWTGPDGKRTQVSGPDILIVAPYNAQVSRLAERLAKTGARVGTVDKFQGQEAPIVIFSMATSRPEDAPRGMEFLYSINRLNVATSRARCAAIVVGNARLFEAECRTPRQIKLANALCRYQEFAQSKA